MTWKHQLSSRDKWIYSHATYSPSISIHLIASSNDHYVTFERAALFAEKWGSQFINLGAHGHINAASGLGNWPAGLECLIGWVSISVETIK